MYSKSTENIAAARNEVELAIKFENAGSKANPMQSEYVDMCYLSALKAFESVANDDHTGLSWQITAQILNRLMNDLPLSPIDDVPDVWQLSEYNSDYKHFNCKRYHSLFKVVRDDGVVSSATYHDLKRQYCVDVDDPNTTFASDIDGVVDEIAPIKFPYMPSTEKYKVFVKHVMVGSTAFARVDHVLTPNGEKVYPERYKINFTLVTKAEFDDSYSKALRAACKAYIEANPTYGYSYDDETDEVIDGLCHGPHQSAERFYISTVAQK